MKRHRPTTGSLGEISHGTMRPEDLIRTFTAEASYLRLTKDERATVRRIIRDTAGGEDYWKGEGAVEDLGMLFDILDAHAPPFCYFGSSEGDGSSYGWWPSMEAIEVAIHDGEVWQEDDKSGMPKTASYRLVVSDHGNMTLYTRKDREVWGIV